MYMHKSPGDAILHRLRATELTAMCHSTSTAPSWTTSRFTRLHGFACSDVAHVSIGQTSNRSTLLAAAVCAALGILVFIILAVASHAAAGAGLLVTGLVLAVILFLGHCLFEHFIEGVILVIDVCKYAPPEDEQLYGVVCLALRCSGMHACSLLTMPLPMILPLDSDSG
jgi:hypothetical protein